MDDLKVTTVKVDILILRTTSFLASNVGRSSLNRAEQGFKEVYTSRSNISHFFFHNPRLLGRHDNVTLRIWPSKPTNVKKYAMLVLTYYRNENF